MSEKNKSIVEDTKSHFTWSITHNTSGVSPFRLLTQENSLTFETSFIVDASAIILHRLNECSNVTGGYVKMLPELNFCPALVADDKELIPLFRFIEVLDELIDYDEIKEEFPNLSFEQIDGAISFLRKFTQFNTNGVDIDELEDQFIREELLTELKEALQDQETHRVLGFSE